MNGMAAAVRGAFSRIALTSAGSFKRSDLYAMQTAFTRAGIPFAASSFDFRIGAPYLLLQQDFSVHFAGRASSDAAQARSLFRLDKAAFFREYAADKISKSVINTAFEGFVCL